MPVTKVLARDWTLGAYNAVSKTFIPILGLNALNFASEKTDADTTTFDEGGWSSHLVASRAKSLTAEGKYLEDISTGDRDPGQQIVEDLANEIGTTSLGAFKLIAPSGKTQYFWASANISETGGGTDDPTSWKAELTVSGRVLEDSPVDENILVEFSSLTANGATGTTTTTELALTFDVEPVGIAATNITLTGATKGALSGSGLTRVLAINTITVLDGQDVTLALTDPAGYSISPSSKTVAVYVHQV